EMQSQPGKLWIKTQVKGDDFSLNPERLLFAKAAGNYLAFYMICGEDTEVLLKRITMKSLEEQTRLHPGLVKTHRAYLVNLNKITHVKGNAQGYQLSFPNAR